MEYKNDKIEELLSRSVEEVIVRGHMEEELRAGKRLRVKFGIDPTAPHIHLGHTVPLRKLRQFQDAGHTAVLIIGDFTATVGDPSGRNETRPMLTEEQVKENMQSYLRQAGKIIDLEKAEVRYNSEWLRSGGVAFIYNLLGNMTVQRALERDDFQKRIQEGHEISLLEVLYPLLQGYDSVAVDADVELGGTDQKFNLLTGRKVQRRYGKKEQDIMALLLIEGTDGVRKMSKSYGNYIALEEEPDSMLGKLMSIPDNLIAKYFIAMTNVPLKEIENMQAAMESGELNPRDGKLRLAEAIVTEYHGTEKAAAARKRFLRVFSRHELPEDMPTLHTHSTSPVDVIVEIGFADSKTKARRLLQEGAVEIDGKKISIDDTIAPKSGSVIKVGKSKFARLEFE